MILSLVQAAAILAMAGALMTGVLLTRESPTGTRVPSSVSRIEATERVPGLLTADSLAPLVAHDPFRLSRTPSPVPYTPNQPAPQVEAPVRPPFLVTGILSGPEPRAVVEGFPGVEGPRLVKVGDVVGRFQVRRIAARAVVIAGPDTTWTLTVREPWR